MYRSFVACGIFQRWLHKIGVLGFAVWPVVVYSTVQASQEEEVQHHEHQHIVQYRKYGLVGFLVRYGFYHLRVGYDANPFEIEARKVARRQVQG